jgi:hypothetical protein
MGQKTKQLLQESNPQLCASKLEKQTHDLTIEQSCHHLAIASQDLSNLTIMTYLTKIHTAKQNCGWRLGY